MNKNEFLQWIMDNYSVAKTHFDYDLLVNVLDYAEGMEEIEQYNFLSKMIPQISDQIIKQVYY